jgi:LysR family transcriptional regulator for bpeEF and oprC
MLDLRSLSVFIKVGERRSFVRAARDLGMTQSGVSNAIARLEDQLGLRLFARTTRKVALTEDGAAFFERCRRVLADLDEAERVLTQSRLAPAGRLRLDLPVQLGRRKIVPLLGAFRAAYPALRLDVSFTDRFIDLVEEGVDVAVRFGALEESSLIARRLTHSQLRVTGAPAYFARHGKPQVPEDLAHHQCLPFAIRDTGITRDWYFKRGAAEFTLRPRAEMSFNDGGAIVAAGCAGYGLIQMNDYSIDDAMASGALEPVLEAFNPAPNPIWLVYPPTRHLSPKVRAFVDFMIARFR